MLNSNQATPKIEACFGTFDNTDRKKWAVTINGELLKHENAWRYNKQVTTFKTEEAAIKAAEKHCEQNHD